MGLPRAAWAEGMGECWSLTGVKVRLTPFRVVVKEAMPSRVPRVMRPLASDLRVTLTAWRKSLCLRARLTGRSARGSPVLPRTSRTYWPPAAPPPVAAGARAGEMGEEDVFDLVGGVDGVDGEGAGVGKVDVLVLGEVLDLARMAKLTEARLSGTWKL